MQNKPQCHLRVFTLLRVLDFSRIGVPYALKSVNITLAHSAEDAVPDSLVLLFKSKEKLLHIFSFGCVVLGAKTFDYGKILPPCEILNVLFLCVYHRSYKLDFSV